MISAQEALTRLRDGNRRFVANESTTSPLLTPSPRLASTSGQAPFAIILGCSDSRVPAEMVFDQGLGDLFVIRVAGNIVAPSQVGSVEFAAERFGTRLVVVMGHTRAARSRGAGGMLGTGPRIDATCARSSTACARRSSGSRRAATTTSRRAAARGDARQRPRLRRSPPPRLGAARAAHPSTTGCASSAPSIRSRPASSSSSMKTDGCRRQRESTEQRINTEQRRNGEIA